MKVKSGGGLRSPQGVGGCGKPRKQPKHRTPGGIASPESVGKKGKPHKMSWPGTPAPKD